MTDSERPPSGHAALLRLNGEGAGAVVGDGDDRRPADRVDLHDLASGSLGQLSTGLVVVGAAVVAVEPEARAAMSAVP